jgi:hypothetical protein
VIYKGMEVFSEWLNESITFTTAKGSVYKFSNGRSQRNKSTHQYHDIKDQGEKEISDRTVFVEQGFAREVGMWGTSSAKKKRVILYDGKIFLVSWNDKAGKHGLDKNIGDNSFVNEPKVGLCPLELWIVDQTEWPWFKQGMEIYKNSHPGNEITQIGQ